MVRVAELYEVPVEAIPPDRLEDVLGRARLSSFLQAATQVREQIDGATIWNVNSTAVGGGVAEMLRALLPWARGAGVDIRWLVISAAPDFFAVTKRVHNHIYGLPGDHGPLGEHERAIYERTMAENVQELRALVRPGDIVILHDPQTTGLAVPMRAAGATVIWRCHIGRDTPNSLTEQGWAFLRPYLGAAHRVVLTRPSFAPTWLETDRITVIPPSLDPFSPKNQPMQPDMVRRILVHTGLVQGSRGPEPLPVFVQADGSPGRVDRHADILQSGPTVEFDAPLVVQISRWDRAKDMGGVMQAFAETVAPSTSAHLLLVGPSVAGVADDPEGGEVLLECMQQWQLLPHTVRARIHLACLPMRDIDENAAIVNALQRRATVVVQKSLAEGFGLTVAEAMWKARPVVASAVGGIQDQIVDGESGVLLHDPGDLPAFGRAVRDLLEDPVLAARLGKAAEQRVSDLFLADTHLERWSNLILTLHTTPPPIGGASTGHIS